MSLTLQIIGAVVAVYVVFAGLMTLMQRNLVFLPSSTKPDPVSSGVPEMREVTLETADGLALFSWYAPATAGRPTLFYAHGNGSDIGNRGPRVRPYRDAGYGVFLLEYRGYGGNPGKPTEEGLQADARAGYAYLRDQGVAATDIILYGESLGTAVAVRLAAEQAVAGEPVGAVVLEAPFSSLTDVAASHYPILPVRLVLKDRFEAVDRVGSIAAPLLIVHGTADLIVPVRFGQRLFAAAAEPKQAVWIDGARHDDLANFGMIGIVLEFIAKHRAVPALP